MKIVLERREIKEHPLIEREIVVDDNKLIVSFSLIDDPNLELSYHKFFPSNKDAIYSAEKFIAREKINTINYASYPDLDSFSRQQMVSKKKLLEDVVNNNIKLPDEGYGFVYDGDFEYISIVLQRIKNRI
ncbi:hypothetical protein [Citrobacter amalonaticus]|uniref:hypothetical protein n=1 Tax=Citrobacter amalonaticus TaxID=35703 RepID=UPI000F6737E2|nr:hypothetical protein [Citrobacter amalonaticus]RSC58277.1 hypothetical protein EGW07_11825 [Citrobacter amalonaticus]